MQNSSILFVDDEEDLLNFACVMFDDNIGRILPAISAEKAFELLEKNSFDCIVSDINMPVMNGIAFLKEARNRNITTPFIFFTGHGDKSHMYEALQFGTVDFINKPNMDGLMDSVHSVLSSYDQIKEKDSSSVKQYQLQKQHQIIFDRIEQIEKLLRGTPSSRRPIDELIDNLLWSIEVHLETEQLLLKKNDCEIIDEIIDFHDKALQQFRSQKNLFDNEEDDFELLKNEISFFIDTHFNKHHKIYNSYL